MKLQTAEPYERLAHFYDQMMAHVDYAMWADYVRDMWFRHASGTPRSCFDAACGTGRFLQAFQEPGLKLGGADRAGAMLTVARRRLRGKCDLSQRDLRELDGAGPWDLVTCLYDSLNYLLQEEELVDSLRRLASLAHPEGLVVFDICTERNSLTHFNDRTEFNRLGEWTWERHSWYNREQRLHHNDFLLEHLPSGRHFQEQHVQRIYAVELAQACAARAGLQVLARYAEFSFRPGGEDADRVHFVARPRQEHL